MSTRSLPRLGAAALAALTVAGLMSGCSSTKKTASAATTTAAAAAASTASAVPAGVAPSETPTKVVATGGGKFCQEVANSENSSAAKLAAEGTDPTSLKQSIQAEQALESEVLKAAPGAIKPDLATLFNASNQLDAALASANYDYTKINPTAISALETPAVTAAEANISAYLKNTCGLDLGVDASAAANAPAIEASAQAALSALEASALAAASS